MWQIVDTIAHLSQKWMRASFRATSRERFKEKIKRFKKESLSIFKIIFMRMVHHFLSKFNFCQFFDAKKTNFLPILRSYAFQWTFFRKLNVIYCRFFTSFQYTDELLFFKIIIRGFISMLSVSHHYFSVLFSGAVITFFA